MWILGCEGDVVVAAMCLWVGGCESPVSVFLCVQYVCVRVGVVCWLVCGVAESGVFPGYSAGGSVLVVCDC